MANRKKQIADFQAVLIPVNERLEALIDELQEAFDNMPESLQGSERGQAAEERIDMLTDWQTSLTDIVETEI